MKTPTDLSMNYYDGDIDTNTSANPHLNDLIANRYSRRQTLFGGLQAAGAAMFGGLLLSGCEDDEPKRAAVVEAGANMTTSSGRTVTLNGTVTSGNASSVAWSQTNGPAVTLAGANTNTATFTAPSVTTATPLVFRFTSTSTTGVVVQAETTVTVGPAQLGFQAVSKSLADVVTVPAGYNVGVLYRLGDPIAANVPAYANNGSDTNFGQRAGDHHDGMTYFGLAASGTAPDPANSTRGLLALNHENITAAYLHPNGPTTTGGVRPEGEAVKEIEAHGVSVIEVARAANDGAWSYVQGSALNRRITPNTPMVFNGPVRGNALLRTRYSADGTAARGTINNCANGTMPWHTYLTNEENWAGYFRRDQGESARRTALGRAKENVSLARYGIADTSNRAGNNRWSTVQPADNASTVFSRWNINVDPAAAPDGTGDFSHEAFQFGWVVEIDPFNPQSAPRKRTALGRMNHEGCQIGRTVAGVRPAFYMGDDAQNEYIYKFVSQTPWVAADANAADRLAVGDKYMDNGTLYVARFNADGSGQWLPLVFGQNGLTASNAIYPFADQADVLVNTRLAADVLGATKMDRPEWTAVNPVTGEMYCTLTNNSSRTAATVDPANPRAYSDPKTPSGDVVNTDPPTAPQVTNGNANGHIIRLRETGDTSEATSFTWDIYAFGSGSDLDPTNINLSGLDASNDFSSCDGLWFSLPSNIGGQTTPLLWIETDDGAYTDQTNCMLLAGIPGTVGDGATRSVTSTLNGVTNTVTTRIGKAPGTSLRRFLVGPKQCEITGIHSTPDGRSLFVNIQHPGEEGSPSNITSNWPANQAGAAPGNRPRSATIVITRADGGIVGL